MLCLLMVLVNAFGLNSCGSTAQNVKFSLKDFFSKCDQSQFPECQKQPPEVFCKKRCSWKFQKIHRKTHVSFLFLIKLQALACNFIKKKTLTQLCSYEFCEVLKNIFMEHLR